LALTTKTNWQQWLEKMQRCHSNNRFVHHSAVAAVCGDVRLSEWAVFYVHINTV